MHETDWSWGVGQIMLNPDSGSGNLLPWLIDGPVPVTSLWLIAIDFLSLSSCVIHCCCRWDSWLSTEQEYIPPSQYTTWMPQFLVDETRPLTTTLPVFETMVGLKKTLWLSIYMLQCAWQMHSNMEMVNESSPFIQQGILSSYRWLLQPGGLFLVVLWW